MSNKVSVKIDIPEGYELAEKEMRAPKPGEWYLSGNKVAKKKAGLFCNPHDMRVILKEKTNDAE